MPPLPPTYRLTVVPIVELTPAEARQHADFVVAQAMQVIFEFLAKEHVVARK